MTLRIFRVHFHWLDVPNSTIDVIAQDASMAIHNALKIKFKAGSNYTIKDIFKVIHISWSEELENVS